MAWERFQLSGLSVVLLPCFRRRSHPVKLFRILFSVVSGALLGLAPARAYAGLMNIKVGAFYAGMMHPLTSAKPLLPPIASALLIGQCGKQEARWALVIFPVASAFIHDYNVEIFVHVA